MASDSTPARGPNTRAGAPGEVLRILVIDESPRDRALIAESLRNGLPESEVVEIQDPAALSAALERADFDVVLADHRPGWIDAFLVLGKVRERHPDLPVLLCTATGSEELAVAAMKAGFSDYVLKHPHHFPRLVSAIRSALAEATRRRIEREAETRYRTLFEGVPVGLYRSTPTGQVLDANPALLRMLGYPSREILMAANLCSLYVDHGAHDRMRRLLDKQGEVQDLEVSWKRYGGQLIWVRENIHAVRDPRGRLLGYEGLVEDITESRRARAELEESNQFREEIISGASEGIVVYDRALRRIVWNRYMEELTGIPAERALGGRAFDISPTLRGPGLELLQAALEGQIVSSGDLFIEVEETGRSGWIVGTYGPHRNAAGDIVGIIGVIRSVTERRRNEQALRESEQRFRRVADAAPVMIWMDDADGLSTYFNKPWLDFTGRALEQELGRGSRDGIHPADLLPRFIAVYDAAFTARRPFQTEYRLRRADGEYRWVLETATPRFTASGDFEGFAGTAIDITERRRADEALRESEQLLRESQIVSRLGSYVLDIPSGLWKGSDVMDKVFGIDGAYEHSVAGWVALIHPADRTMMTDYFGNEVLGQGRAFNKEYRIIRHNDQAERWVHGLGKLEFDARGLPRKMLGTIQDITERRRADEALKESEARFRLMADAAPVLVWISDASARCTFFNKPWLDFTGRLLEQEIGSGWMESVHPDDLALVRRFDELEGTEKPYQYEYRLRRHDGEYRWVLDTGVPRFTPEGAFEGYIGSVIDITDRRRAEEALKESEARYRTQVENAPEAIVVFDVDTGRFVEANDNAARLWGFSRADILEKDPAALSPPVQPDGRPSAGAIAENVGRTLRGETPLFEWIHRDALGRDIPCEVRLARLPSATRRLVRGSVIDISERKRAEKLQSALYRIAATTSATEDIDEFYRAIHAIVGELMYAKNFYVALHDAYTNLISYPYCVDEVDPTPEPMPPGNGLTAHVLRTGEALLSLDADFTAMLGRGEVELIGSNSVAWLGVPLKRGGKTFGVLVVQSYDPRFTFGEKEKEVLTFVSQQIAVALERKRAQEAMRESEERYRLLFERNLAGVYRMTLVGRILECNDALARIFGYASREELVDRDMAVLYPDARQRKDFFDALLRARGLANYEMRGERKDGGIAWTFQNASLLADEQAGEVIVEGTVSDITERRQLEEQLRQAQKMEAIGQLAGGVAHDFNNLLTAVLGYSDMALSQLSAHDPIREDIAEIRKAGQRASSLTRQLLAFSRKQVLEPRVLDLNALIAESSRMLARLIGEDIRFVTLLDPELGSVRADPGQIEQVIVNLAVNARDAMPEGGTLTIARATPTSTAPHARDHGGVGARPVRRHLGQRHGHRHGPETQKRIFEPFFTTKEKPHGHGARPRDGLRHRQPERRQHLRRERARPRHDLRDLPAPRRGGRHRRGRRRPRGRDPARAETILLVEDEAAVRGLTLRCLQRAATPCSRPRAPRRRSRSPRATPGASTCCSPTSSCRAHRAPSSRGACSKEARHTRPLRLGLHRRVHGLAGRARRGAYFLQKPFTPETLARKVREVLDAREAPVA